MEWNFIDIVALVGMAALACSAVCTLAYLIQLSRLLRLLESRSPEIHAALGSPSLFLNNTPWNSLRVVRFLLGRTYLSISDHRTVQLASQCRTLFILGTAATVSAGVLLLGGDALMSAALQ